MGFCFNPLIPPECNKEPLLKKKSFSLIDGAKLSTHSANIFILPVSLPHDSAFPSPGQAKVVFDTSNEISKKQ